MLLMRDYSRIPHGRMCAQNNFNFAWFDPVPANLYLMVCASEILDVSIGAVTPQVTGAVETLPGDAAVAVWDKLVGGQSCFIQITTGQSRSPDVNLSCYINRNRFHLLIENVYL